MRIGVMLRHLEEHNGGVLVYTRNLLRELLRLDSDHEFVLMYSHPRHVGTYAGSPRVREVAEYAAHRGLWDQVAVPRMALRERVDVVFNPKYSVPLLTEVPSVFVSHGMDWYVEPHWSGWPDRLNHALLVPRFAKRAAKIIAVSETARNGVIEFLGVPGDRVDTVYLGVSEHFRRPMSDDEVAAVAREFGLPPRFFLYVGQIYPPKNFGRLVRAFARVARETDAHLVVAGRHTFGCASELRLIDELGVADRVVWAGWVDHSQLRAFYRSAEALVMPSLYEACPSPPLEAMASGCPVITADRYGTREIAGRAALLVDPYSVDAIAGAMRSVAGDPALRRRLSEAGRGRVDDFSWPRCAEETLGVIESAAGSPVESRHRVANRLVSLRWV